MKSLKSTHFIIGIVIGLAFLAIWLLFVSFDDLLENMANIRPHFIIPAIILYLSSYFFRSLRLKVLLSPKHNIPVDKNYLYAIAGNYLNYIIPLRSGEVAKCVFFKKNHDISYSNSIPPVFIDKIFDTFVICIVLALIPLTGIILTRELSFIILMLVIIFLIGASLLIIAAVSKDHAIRVISKLLYIFPQKIKDKINQFIEKFVDGMAIFKHHKRLLTPCILLTLVATLTDTTFFYLMFVALGIEIPFLYVMLGYTLLFMSYIVPHPPAQIGSNQLLMTVIFGAGLGQCINLMGSVIILSHFVTAVVIFSTGSLSLGLIGVKMMCFDADTTEDTDLR
jgi:uncharacterized protein (TIRG00374 family)